MHAIINFMLERTETSTIRSARQQCMKQIIEKMNLIPEQQLGASAMEVRAVECISSPNPYHNARGVDQRGLRNSK